MLTGIAIKFFKMKIGQKIVFDLEVWIGEEMIMEEHTYEILQICIDPLGRHESKCIVVVTFSGLAKATKRWLVCRVAFAKPVLYEVPTYLR